MRHVTYALSLGLPVSTTVIVGISVAMGGGCGTPESAGTSASSTTTSSASAASSSSSSSGTPYYERETRGDAGVMGSWEQVPFSDAGAMQSIHAALLPDGTVLVVNGSSNRNTIQPDGTIQDGSKLTSYAVTDNMGVFDPTPGHETFTTYHVPHPPVATPPVSNDLFCSGQLQLPNGNVLFAGGTGAYYPGEKFNGTKFMYAWDWVNKVWLGPGLGQDGHWYPSLAAFGDGHMMVVSGLASGLPPLNASPNQASTVIEFYDSSKKIEDPAAWQAVDILNVKGNPFHTTLPAPQTGLDGFQLYPRYYAMPGAENVFFLTHDGVGFGTNGGDQSKLTYFMTVTFPGGKPSVAFSPGPLRNDYNKIYGSSVVDPTTGDFLLFGGQRGGATVNNNDYGPGPWSANHPGVAVTRTLERFVMATKTWAPAVDDFLGDSPEDARMMHVATILPTKQVLIINGGNYAYHRPLFYPILLTPAPAGSHAPGGFLLRQMNQALQPRMYHNVSLLLPDGRVLTSGGNAARAAFQPDGGAVRMDVYKDPNGVYQTYHHGQAGLSAEVWEMEIYSPPYLFLPAETRPAFVFASPTLNGDKKEKIVAGAGYDLTVTHPTPGFSLVMIKLGSVTHGWDSGQRMIDLTKSATGTSTVHFTAPAISNTAPPAYYMLFYVSSQGQPSMAHIVQLAPT